MNKHWRVVCSPIALAGIALGVCSGGGLGGCSSSAVVARRESGLIVGTQGSGSELVFAGVDITGQGGGVGDLAFGPELSRVDASLSARAEVTQFDADAWPTTPRPSLDDARLLYVPRSTRAYLYFDTGYRFRAGTYRYGY